MAKWSDWRADVMTRAIGVTVPLLDQEVKRAAQEFLRRTRVWVEWLDAEVTADGNGEYYFDVPSAAVVVRVEQATLGGRPFPIESFRERTSDWTAPGATDAALVTADRALFHIGAAAPAGQLLQVQASLAPGERATGIPAELYAQHHQHIAHGALARLLSIPGQPWTNFDLAAMHIAAFERAIGSVGAEAWRGHTAHTPRPRVRWC